MERKDSVEFCIEHELLTSTDVVLLSVAGYLDAYSFQLLEERIAAFFLNGQYRIIIDLSGTRYISSAGVGVLIAALTETHEHKGNIILLNPSKCVLDVLALLGLAQILNIVDDKNAALAKFNSEPIH